jgi:hypothetical protein
MIGNSIPVSVSRFPSFFKTISEKMTFIFVFWQGFWSQMGENKRLKTARLKCLYEPIGEV